MPSQPWARCGIDLGIGQERAVIAHDDDTIERIAHPASWAAVQQQRRRIARQLSRRVIGSRGHRQANAKLAALDRRAVNLRRESIHTLTTSLARRYGTVVIEDLDIAAMGRRAFRRSLYQAELGRVRPTLAYRCAWGGGGAGGGRPVVRVLQIPLVRRGSPRPTSPSWSSATWSAASRSKCSV
jgi:putative transposase